MAFNALEWLKANVEFTVSTSASAIYGRMESQSGHCLPGIYVTYDPKVKWHFVDRGQILDFVHSVGNGRILDFGPGDGWPSLPMAPMVEWVVGVDGSPRRTGVCTRNAERLGIMNATFVTVPPGEDLPFGDDSFDGVVASSSIEQTPDPAQTLKELHRVLKPGGRLRMHYESLSHYHGDERGMWMSASGIRETFAIIYDRNILGGFVDHYCLVLDQGIDWIRGVLAPSGGEGIRYADLKEHGLAELLPYIKEACCWRGTHPSCQTWLGLLHSTGFTKVEATHNGGDFAGELLDRLPEDKRPRTPAEADRILAPLVAIASGMAAPSASVPGKWDPWITAVK